MEKMSKSQRQAIANKYVGHEVTLNGKPARIIGRLQPFATVWNETTEAVFSWQTVKKVCDNGGNFTT